MSDVPAFETTDGTTGSITQTRIVEGLTPRGSSAIQCF
jgi:hypothetical protein